jgi:hypothetical protein
MTTHTKPRTSYQTKLGILLSLLGFAMLSLTACGQDAAASCGLDEVEETKAAERVPFATAQPVVRPGVAEADAKVYVLKPTMKEKAVPAPIKAIPAAKTAPAKTAKTAAKTVKTAAKTIKTPPRTPAATLNTFRVQGSFGVIASAVATGLDKRTPVGISDQFTTDTDKIWAFIKVKNRDEPTMVTMIWKKAGKKVWSYDLRVGKSYGWRTWSRKSVTERDLGKWSVEVLDADGQLLHTMHFSIVAAGNVER